MIVVEDIYKHYQGSHGAEKWVLQGVSFTIPAKVSVGLIGGTGVGKSTLLRLIGGIEPVTRGRIKRHCRVSWPMGYGGALQKSMTGRQNAKFIYWIHGLVDDIENQLAYLQDFSELGEAFDKPIKTYSPAMRARFLFSLFIASDFDIYISDVGMAVAGDPAFKKKAALALEKLANQTGILMAAPEEKVLKRFCSAGIWLHEGQAHWFDDINDALKHHKENAPV